MGLPLPPSTRLPPSIRLLLCWCVGAGRGGWRVATEPLGMVMGKIGTSVVMKCESFVLSCASCSDHRPVSSVPRRARYV